MKRWQCFPGFDQSRCNDLGYGENLDSSNTFRGIDVGHRGVGRAEVESNNKAAGL